jgi:hypothetical protein
VASSEDATQLLEALNDGVQLLEQEVQAVRPDYYQNLACSLDTNSLHIRYLQSNKQKIMTGNSVCNNPLQ